MPRKVRVEIFYPKIWTVQYIRWRLGMDKLFIPQFIMDVVDPC